MPTIGIGPRAVELPYSAAVVPGRVLAEKYRLDEVIGEGSMGIVWRATQLGLGRAVAVKVLHGALARREDTRARFVREARVAAALRHPAVVAVLDFGETDGALYLVMELLVGQTLRGHMAEERLPIAEAARIAVDVATALVAAHQIHLVHRDLKPENIFLETSEDGYRVRVVDFGLAFISAPPGETHGSLGRMTEEGILGGTPLYMSPEQTRALEVGPESDVYALGCVFYELVLGRPPFGGAIAELLTRHAYAAPIPLRKLAPDLAIDPLVDELVLAMLAKSPAARPLPQHIVDVLGPIAAGAGAGGRSRSNEGRAERMVGLVPPPAPEPVLGRAPTLAQEATIVAWIGAADEALALGLAVNGFEALPSDGPTVGRVVFAPGASLETLAALVAAGRPVVTDVPSGDLDGITARLRAGVAEVVSRPVRPEELARKLLRALRRRPT